MSLTLITGPMMSGKTSRIIEMASKHHASTNSRPLYLLSYVDTRDPEEYISSHFKHFKSLNLFVDVKRITNLEEITDQDLEEITMICIDEVQFLNNIYETIKKWLLMGIKIVVGGLSGDYRMKSFGEIKELIPLCNKIVLLHSFCKECYQNDKIQVPAYYTKRITDDTEEILIGGSQQYTPVCLKHSQN